MEAAEGKATAAEHHAAAAALLGVEATMEEVSAEGETPLAPSEDPAAKEKKLPSVEKPLPSEDPAAGKQNKVSVAAVNLAPSPKDPAEKEKKVSVSVTVKPAPSKEPAAEKEKDPAPSVDLEENEKKRALSDDPAAKQKLCIGEEKAAPSDDPAAKQKLCVGEASKAAGEKRDVPAQLPVDMALAVAARLPSKDAALSAVLSKDYRDRVGEPVFLMSHLAPRSYFFVGETVPTTVVLQPAAEGLREGYTHLTIVRLRDNFVFDMPVVRAADEEGGGGYYNYSINFDLDRCTPHDDRRTPPPFFYKTIPDLDLTLLASEGRLAVAFSPTHGLFLCNPAEDRFVHLPAPPIFINSRQTAAAIRYTLGDCGEIDSLHVVLLSPRPAGDVAALQSFSTDGAGWVVTDIDESVHAVLERVSAPGVYASELHAFYWIDGASGSIIQCQLDGHLLSVVPPPPIRDGFPEQMGWAVGCTGGLPRLSCFSVTDEAHGFDGVHDIDGLLSVWMKNQNGWVVVKEMVVPVAWVFDQHRRLELPVDMARANREFLMVRKDREVLYRDLQRDELHFVSNLYLREDAKVHGMYTRFKAFSV